MAAYAILSQKKGTEAYKNTIALQNQFNLELGRCGMRIRAFVDEYDGSIWLGKEEKDGIARLPPKIVYGKITTARISEQCLQYEGKAREIAPKILIGLAYFVEELAGYEKSNEDKQEESET